MVKMKKGSSIKSPYETKTPKIGQNELRQSKKALELLRTNSKNKK